ncbi:MAG: hypothetical protein CM15mP103_07440 [Gammaproteobacteria bacterium]|nr:MAG: hypothetical protein CM15mP103_07440 [Gammaproteobacteria bacterium]
MQSSPTTKVIPDTSLIPRRRILAVRFFENWSGFIVKFLFQLIDPVNAALALRLSGSSDRSVSSVGEGGGKRACGHEQLRLWGAARPPRRSQLMKFVLGCVENVLRNPASLATCSPKLRLAGPS